MNWKQRYEDLVKLTEQFITQIQEVNLFKLKIESHIAESKRLDLQSRNVRRFMRLKENVSLNPVYEGGQGGLGPLRNYESGTLIDCEPNGRVYLDDDGDGWLHFPPELLEEVEVNVDCVDWNNVVLQG